jgi:hypothetical protein
MCRQDTLPDYEDITNNFQLCFFNQYLQKMKTRVEKWLREQIKQYSFEAGIK